MKKCMSCGKTVSKTKMKFCPDCGGGLVEFNEKDTAPIVPAGEATGFCMYCGAHFNEFGVCPKCGNRSSDQSKVLNKPEAYGKRLTECLRGLFSASPFNGIENAGRETGSTIWLICAGAFVLFVSLAVTNILSRFSVESGTGAKALDNMLTLGAFTGVGGSFFGILIKLLLTAVGVFFASTAMLWLPMKLSGEKVSYVQLMNINSFSLAPVTLVALVSFIVSFFAPGLAMFLLPVGAFMSVIMLYYAIQKLARFKTSPFWAFTGALLGDSIICYLCMFVLGKLFA